MAEMYQRLFDREIPTEYPASVPNTFFKRVKNKASGNCFTDSIKDSKKVDTGIVPGDSYSPASIREEKEPVSRLILSYISGSPICLLSKI